MLHDSFDGKIIKTITEKPILRISDLVFCTQLLIVMTKKIIKTKAAKNLDLPIFFLLFISLEKESLSVLAWFVFLQTLKRLPEISISVLFEGLIEVVVMAHQPQEVFNPRSHLSAVSETSNKAIKTSKGCSQPRPHPAVASFPVQSHHPNPPGSNVIYAEGLKPSMSTMPHSPVR